jgi:hypothetical protein
MPLVLQRICLCLLFLFICESEVLAVPRYRITPLAITDAEHTREDGLRFSSVDWPAGPNQTGYVSGYSFRFDGGNIELGRTAWLYNGLDMIDIGLMGDEYTHADGSQVNLVTQLNEMGQVLGSSRRYDGGTQNLGESVWLYDGTTTHQIGFIGDGYIRSDGYKFANGLQLNEAGQAIGYSERFSRFNSSGTGAWLYNDSQTVEIGIPGFSYNYPTQINRFGQISGNSKSISGYQIQESHAWLSDGISTIEIGPLDSDHTRPDGYRFNVAGFLNDAGYILGSAKRFSGYTDIGESVWLSNGLSTVEIGFVDSDHTRSDGYRWSVGSQLNAASQAAGHSARFEGDNSIGYNAWFYNGINTIEIGLKDSEHTQFNGYQSSTVWRLNDAGFVSGDSTRFYTNIDSAGQSSWLYNGESTVNIGLTSEEFAFGDGTHYSQCVQMNQKGQVVGINYSQSGTVAWFYDPNLMETFPLQLGAQGHEYAYSVPTYLGDDGLVLGTYRSYDDFGNDTGDRAFYFTVQDGMHDLGSLVEGGLLANGWESLTYSARGNRLGHIAGDGKAFGGGRMAYLLTPIVPEPTSISLALFGLLFAYSSCRPAIR